MSVTPAATAAQRTMDREPVQLVCAEVWGGNLPIDSEIELPGLQGRIFSQPCDGGRGGDVHYLATCSSGLLARIVVADVAGHGEKVATVSTSLHRLLRRYMNQPDQRKLLVALNNALLESDSAAMTTAAAVTYYPPARSLSVSYAGHPPVWLRRRSEGVWKELKIDSARRESLCDMPLAVVPGLSFTRATIRVETGDRLLILTDGILEAPGRNGELFGTARLAGLLNSHGESSPETIEREVLSTLRSFSSADLSHDDVTMLAIEFVPGPRGPALWHAIRNRIQHRRGNRPEADRP